MRRGLDCALAARKGASELLADPQGPAVGIELVGAPAEGAAPLGAGEVGVLVGEPGRPGVAEGVVRARPPVGTDREVGVLPVGGHLAAGVVGRLLHQLVELDAGRDRDVDRTERVPGVDAQLARPGGGRRPRAVLDVAATGHVTGLGAFRGVAPVVLDAGLQAEGDVADGHEVVPEGQFQARTASTGRPSVFVLDLRRARADTDVPVGIRREGRGAEEEGASGRGRENRLVEHGFPLQNGRKASCLFHIHITPYLIICQYCSVAKLFPTKYPTS